MEFRELLFEVGKRGESTTLNDRKYIHKLWKAGERNLGHIVGEERALPYWQKLRCFTTNTMERHWPKIKVLHHFDSVQEGSSFPRRHVAVKKIVREARPLVVRILVLSPIPSATHIPINPFVPMNLRFTRFRWKQKHQRFPGEINICHQVTSCIRIF